MLCKWHVKRAWLKNLITKVKTWEKRSAMFSALGAIMDFRGQAEDSQQQLHAAAMERLKVFYVKFADQTSFISYLQREWESKIGEIPLAAKRSQACNFRHAAISASGQ